MMLVCDGRTNLPEGNDEDMDKNEIKLFDPQNKMKKKKKWACNEKRIRCATDMLDVNDFIAWIVTHWERTEIKRDYNGLHAKLCSGFTT